MKSIVCALSLALILVSIVSRDRSGRLLNLQTEMALYMLANPQASAAALTSGGEIATFLEQNLDSGTKTALLFVGSNSTNYCLDSANFQDCAKVTANLTAYAVKIASETQVVFSISGRTY
jgi:hypothetical protein